MYVTFVVGRCRTLFVVGVVGRQSFLVSPEVDAGGDVSFLFAEHVGDFKNGRRISL